MGAPALLLLSLPRHLSQWPAACCAPADRLKEICVRFQTCGVRRKHRLPGEAPP